MIGKNFRTQASIAAAALGLMLGAGQAQADTLVVDVSDIVSYGELDSPDNVYQSYNIGAFSEITAISWDLTITATSPSWLSEITLELYSTDYSSDIFFTPAVGEDSPGTTSSSGSVVLSDIPLTFFVGADGLLNLQFFEAFDDASVAPDGFWDSGTITFEYAPVPEPETYALMLMGLAGVGAIARRRKAS